MAAFGTCEELNMAGISDAYGKVEAGEVIEKTGDLQVKESCPKGNRATRGI